MSDAATDVGASVPMPEQELNSAQTAVPDFMRKYGEERAKRTRDDGMGQYINPLKSEKWKHVLDDPAVEVGTPVNRPIADGGRVSYCIIGCGFGGILFAVRLIQAGVSVDDIILIDKSGGFGGTWWWNRYPGLMCDVESYIYLPLLEEMNYMPRRKYSSGEEIRDYADSMATKYGLHQRAMFQSTVKTTSWDDKSSEWIVKVAEQPKGGAEICISIRADFVMFASGVLNNAKLPELRGMETFQGHMFHTARWDWKFTGGTQADPALTGLESKRVAFIGTGATGVQAIPELAKFAKDLYVFQRTPSSVDARDNKETDPMEWRQKIATKKGWQRERSENFNAFITNAQPKPAKNLVDDAWTQAPSYSALVGGPKKVTMENVGDHVGQLHALDYVRTDRIRKRAEDIVNDENTAKKLQAWYPTWCKRPCFHDEYLQAFNSPNVHLVDTEGKGVDRITAKGVEFNGNEYPVDVLIWGTGFVSPTVGTAAGKASIEVTGKGGVSMEQRNDRGELTTLHGIASPDFPNMFWPGPLQAAATANQVYNLDVMATHVAYIVTESAKQAGGKPRIEPNRQAVENWAMQIMAGAVAFAALSGCTPGYLNREGETDKIPPEARMVAARNSIWAEGIKSYTDILESWRAKGGLEGLEVTKVA